MGNELISVIIPVYNAERYLASCLDSVLSQSYRNLEVIIINDGSSDYSLKVAEGYAEKDDRIRVYSFENEGLSEARNRGLSVATGDFITFVDSDDMLTPEAMEVMMGYLIRYSADIVEGKVIRGKVFVPAPLKTKITVKEFNFKDAIEDVLFQKTLLPSACGTLYKKSLFENLKFEKGLLYEDLNIIYRVLERCNKIVWIDYPVYFYRETEGSILDTWTSKRLDVLKVTEKMESYIAERYPELLPAARDRRLSANFNMFALCSLNDDHENASKCWQHIKRNRKQSLFNPKVRLKNKAGIILSYFGKNIFNIAARRVYK